MNQKEKQFEYEDEIDLMDYVKVIFKRKWLILVIFLVAVIAAGIFSYFAPKIYKIDSSLEMGIIGDKVIEEPSQVIGKINGDAYGILVREKLNISEENYPKIKTENPKDTNLVKMEIESPDPQRAKKVLEEVNDTILKEHQKELESEKKPLESEEEIETLEANIDIIKGDIERIKTKIRSLREEKENLQAEVIALQKILPSEMSPETPFILFNTFALFDTKEKLEQKKQEIEDQYLKISSFEIKINSLESGINSLKEKKEPTKVATKIVKVPTVSEKPVKPKILLNVIIAAILGIFIGIFGAFFKEWWEKSKA